MTGAEPPIRPTEHVVHLEDARMRIRERGELVSESATAVTLLSAAWDAYSRHQVDVFVVLNGVAGTALAIAVLHGVRQMRRHHDAASTGVNVVGIFGGLTAIVEGLHRLHAAHFTPGRPHFALGVCTIAAGLMTTIVALLMERLERGRALRISDRGVAMRLNRIRRFHAAWTDISELQLDDREARLVRTRGRARVIPLARLVNRDEVREALTLAMHARGIPVTDARATSTPRTSPAMTPPPSVG